MSATLAAARADPRAVHAVDVEGAARLDRAASKADPLPELETTPHVVPHFSESSADSHLDESKSASYTVIEPSRDFPRVSIWIAIRASFTSLRR